VEAPVGAAPSTQRFTTEDTEGTEGKTEERDEEEGAGRETQRFTTEDTESTEGKTEERDEEERTGRERFQKVIDHFLLSSLLRSSPLFLGLRLRALRVLCGGSLPSVLPRRGGSTPR
jgi:hypothetical protein